MSKIDLKIKRAYQDLFQTENGKIVLKDLMRECHFLQPTFIPGDPLSGSFNEGKRRILLRIINFLTKDEEELIKLIELNNKRYEEYNE
jgi:hypothetical protein